MIAALTPEGHRTAVLIVILLSYFLVVDFIAYMWAHIREEEGLGNFLLYASFPATTLLGRLLYELWLT